MGGSTSETHRSSDSGTRLVRNGGAYAPDRACCASVRSCKTRENEEAGYTAADAKLNHRHWSTCRAKSSGPGREAVLAVRHMLLDAIYLAGRRPRAQRPQTRAARVHHSRHPALVGLQLCIAEPTFWPQLRTTEKHERRRCRIRRYAVTPDAAADRSLDSSARAQPSVGSTRIQKYLLLVQVQQQ